MSSRDSGFSLVELMVALTIGLIIMAAVSVMFVNTRQSYTNQDRLSRVQENGRFAMYYLVRDLRMTQFTGCQRDVATKVRNNLTVKSGFNFGINALSSFIEGASNVTGKPVSASTWAPSGDAASIPAKNVPASVSADPPTDILALHMVDTAASAAVTDSPMTSYTANPTVDNATGFTKGDIVLLTDCVTGDLFQLTGSSVGSKLPHGTGCTADVVPCNDTNELSKQYDTAARVYRFATRRYFIRYNANGNPSLYRDDNGAGTTELVEGIESLQILFGVTNSPPSGPPNQYYKANDVNLNWANVVSVRIGILARTPNQQDADVDTRTYDVNGTVLGPFNDRNSRRVFMTTVSLRNRVLP